MAKNKIKDKYCNYSARVFTIEDLLSMKPWAAAKKTLSVTMPQALVRVPSQRPLAPSVTSVTSVANDKGDNKMILGAVHRSPGICLTAKENP